MWANKKAAHQKELFNSSFDIRLSLPDDCWDVHSEPRAFPCLLSQPLDSDSFILA